ncbi:hypothetical protein J6590_056550 [Homalodisca vitripennis]|nr:hypothetical protein J6590_056550 [Homalodisca vitripennis]
MFRSPSDSTGSNVPRGERTGDCGLTNPAHAPPPAHRAFDFCSDLTERVHRSVTLDWKGKGHEYSALQPLSL